MVKISEELFRLSKNNASLSGVLSGHTVIHRIARMRPRRGQDVACKRELCYRAVIAYGSAISLLKPSEFTCEE